MSFGFSIGDIIAVSKLTNKVRKQFIDSPGQFKAISDEVKSLSNVLRDLEDVLPARDLTKQQQTDLCDATQGCNNVLLDLEKLIDKYHILDSDTPSLPQKSRRLWKRVKWEPEDVRDIRSRIASNIGLLNAFSGSLTREYVVRLNKSQDDQERRDITDWLSPLDFSAQQSDFIGRRQEGTGKWLLESKEYKTWLGEAGQTLFCPGIPGAGKTMIASIVIDSIWETFQADDDIGVAFLFCSYKRQNAQKLEDLMGSLLKQLARNRNILPEKVRALYHRYMHRMGPMGRPTINEIAKVLRSVTCDCSRVYLIIDALDECNTRHRKLLLEKVFELQAAAQLNLFMTSRFIPDISKEFDGQLSLEIRASEDDVRRYLDNHIPQLPACVQKNSALGSEIISEIIKAVDGMFLLAQLHLDSLRHKTTIKSIKLAMRNLPKGSEALDVAYKEAIERIEAQPTDHRELARRVLSWITYAERPLSIIELQHALAVEIGEPELDEDNLPEIEEIVSACAGLVAVDQKSKMVRLVHHTTQEYLEQIREKWIPNGQTDLAKTCLTYLSFDTFASGFCNVDEEFEATFHRNEFLTYAIHNWASHIREAELGAVQTLGINLLRDEHKTSFLGQFSTIKDYELKYKTLGYSQRSSKCVSGVHIAAYFGLHTLLPLLLDSGLLPDLRDDHGRTPLSWSAIRGHDSVVRLLVKRSNVAVDSKDDQGRTPLSHAAGMGCKAVVEILVSQEDVAADSRDNCGRTPLSHAAEWGYEAVVRTLVSRSDVTTDSMDNLSMTPLLYAIRMGFHSVVRLLLIRNDVAADSKDYRGRTILSHAASLGRGAMVEMLISRDDVTADSRDNQGRTPFSYAAAMGYWTVIRMLISRDDVMADSRDNQGRTPLSYAAERGREAVVRKLVSHDNVRVDTMDNQGRTPLSYAAGQGHDAVVKMLVTQDNVTADSRDHQGRTPLSYAAFRGDEDVVRILMSREDVNAYSEDFEGRTPLSWAAESGNEAVVALLIAQNDIAPISKDNEFQTPVSYAAGRVHEAMVAVLSAQDDITADLKKPESFKVIEE